MKTKQIIAVVFLAIALASCSQYTCPTYAKSKSVKACKVVRL